MPEAAVSTAKTAGSPRAAPDVDPRRTRLAAGEISLLLLIVGAVAVASAFPFKPVKYGLIVFFIVVMIGQTMRRPAMGLALLVFAVPALDMVPPDLVGIPAINAETIMIAFGLFIWARARNLYGPDPFGSTLGTIVGVYCLLILFSSVNAYMIWKWPLTDMLASAKNHVAFMVFLPIAFHTARERRDQWLLVGAISLSLLLNCAQGIEHSLPAFLSGRLERYRAMAILALQPNTFGAALAMYIPLLLVYATNKVTNRLTQMWFAACTFFALWALFFTLSRGAWMGLAIGLVVVALLGDRKVLVLLLIAVPTYNLWVPQEAVDRVAVTTRVGEEDDQLLENSAQMRIEQYNSLGAMMAPRPILGWGYRSYGYVFEKYGTLKRNKGPHSSYCQLGTEGGIVGLGALGAVLLGMAWTGFRARRVLTDPFHRWLGVAVCAGALSMAVSMITGARFEPQKIFAFYWVIAGIAERETLVALRSRFRSRPLALAVAGRAEPQKDLP